MEKKIINTIIILVVFCTTLKSQWTVYNTNTTMDLYKIQFVNASTGFAAGGEYSEEAGFFKTTDAGLNWQRYIITDTISWNFETIYGMFFVNANTGYVSGRYLIVFKTTNGGLNWTSSVPPYYNFTQIYNALYFLNENTGYAAGRYGYFCKTTNGGNNWSLVNVLSANLFCLKFFNEMTGYVGDGAGIISKTTDGGLTFTQQDLGFFQINNLFFANENTGYCIGLNIYYGAVLKTTNSGMNWINVYENNNKSLYDLDFVNNFTGFACGDGIFLKTTNSGNNWLIYEPLFRGFGIDFYNSDVGFISGDGGKIYKTLTGGVGINQISTSITSKYSLGQNYPNPFNPTTKIRFDVGNGFPVKTSGNDKGGNFVVLKVYDVMGREVQTLINERLQPGTYETTFDGFMQNSGIYFYKLTTDGFSETKKMLLLK